MPFTKTHMIKDQIEAKDAHHEIQWVRYDRGSGVAMQINVWGSEQDKLDGKPAVDSYETPRQQLSDEEMEMLTTLFEAIGG